MTLVGQVLGFALQIFFYLMIARFIAELVMSFNRSWRPSGLLLPVLDITYSITDPPLKFVRRFVPPIQLGGISLDLAWTIVLFGVLILQGFARAL
ncbi:MAG: YggT family protein [Aquiluna sp.]|jgi:YggT family protein|uniref:YggT family protein n=1 Tax=Aquiluna sp. TaxID=2053504 RepID=UPI0027553E71|nr:YggT family protein [Aquiluna sp.]MDP4887092.1 YggT family protein [Aquiluna sp.]MDP5026293.1 YggT family protein [Aquiluna sp.]